jgi:hypothetical protein
MMNCCRLDMCGYNAEMMRGLGIYQTLEAPLYAYVSRRNVRRHLRVTSPKTKCLDRLLSGDAHLQICTERRIIRTPRSPTRETIVNLK